MKPTVHIAQLDHAMSGVPTCAVAEADSRSVEASVDVDRLTRTDDMAERAAILGPFQRAGIEIVTPTSGRLDLRTFLGEFHVLMQALVAAEENRKRSERIKAGKLRAIAEGRKPAGPTPFGLVYERSTGRWSVDADAAAIVREIYRRVAGGESCVQYHDGGSVQCRESECEQCTETDED